MQMKTKRTRVVENERHIVVDEVWNQGIAVSSDSNSLEEHALGSFARRKPSVYPYCQSGPAIRYENELGFVNPVH